MSTAVGRGNLSARNGCGSDWDRGMPARFPGWIFDQQVACRVGTSSLLELCRVARRPDRPAGRLRRPTAEGCHVGSAPCPGRVDSSVNVISIPCSISRTCPLPATRSGYTGHALQVAEDAGSATLTDPAYGT